MKECSKCGAMKPMTNKYFHNAKNNKDGLSGVCKICRAKYAKQRRANKKEEISEYMKKWRAENKDHVKEYNAEHYRQNAEYHKNKAAKWRANNREKHRDYSRQHYKENPEYYAGYRDIHKEKYAEYAKKYNKEFPEVSRRAYNKRQAKKEQLPNTLTEKQWSDVCEVFDHKCCYCGESTDLEQEHFVALSKGGGYTHSNIIPACRKCNSSKNNRSFFEWYPNYEHYSKEREQRILDYLGYEKQTNTQQLALF